MAIITVLSEDGAYLGFEKLALFRGELVRQNLFLRKQ
jgi:hypothetical protein